MLIILNMRHIFTFFIVSVYKNEKKHYAKKVLTRNLYNGNNMHVA